MAEKKLVIAREAIAGRVKELGSRITADYQGRQLLVVGILNGAFIFMADLIREIDLPLEIDFVRVKSYGAGSSSSGTLNFTKDVEIPMAGKDLLLVEDIIDTGLTIANVKEIFAAKNPLSIKVCALIDKKERRKIPIVADYVGFEIEEGFLVGYGLDFAEKHRHYHEVYHLLNCD
ncbi:MAG: hypoxanthine phosphoribosyltransferase [Deltaproteobacteria bacterium RIFOXYD12_FULL_50_9]|nr:MAG: hypoxanthine phosphoribosyltransferase [Deltaproteobacteria bacterium RIFOXYD12_FULL_50_9]